MSVIKTSKKSFISLFFFYSMYFIAYKSYLQKIGQDAGKFKYILNNFNPKKPIDS